MTTLERLLVNLAEVELADNEKDRNAAKAALREAVAETRSNKKTAEMLVREIMAELGAPESLIGHPYTVKAILLCIEDEKMIDNITFRLYPTVAAHFDTMAARVERGIRNVIEVTWTRGDADAIYKYFRNTVSAEKCKPTNGEFIARISNIVRVQISK